MGRHTRAELTDQVLAQGKENVRLRAEVKHLRGILEAIARDDERVCERMSDLRCGECAGCLLAREDGDGS